jgi:23S rRNA pseudouridine1911/1915/1917 synthase
MQTFVVDADNVGSRLDVFLVSQLPVLSRSSLQKLCNDDKVFVNEAAQPVKYKVREGDSVTVHFDPKDLDEIPDIELPILYEDDDCLVIDKPAGILTHSKGGFNPEATVATFIRDRVTGMEGERAGIVHRLDRGTSGVIICAKTPEALSHLQKQFSSRKVKKEYIAVIEGSLERPEALIDAAIARNMRNPKTFMVSPAGKPAETAYATERTDGGYSLLTLKPKTGRTHQLRVHLTYLKHPIVGDTLYKGKIYSRMLLHAHKLEITLPNSERKVFIAPTPPEFEGMLDG